MRVLLATDDAALATRLQPVLGDCAVQDTLLGLYAAVQQTEPELLLVDGALPQLALEAALGFLKGKGVLRHRAVVLLASHEPDAPDPAELGMRCFADDVIDRAAAPHAVRAGVGAALARKTSAFDSIPDTGARAVPRSSEGKAKVLVVDDDEAIARLLTKMLSSRYDVTAVNDGETAIALAADNDFAAIFCDLRMPGASGADVFRAIHQRDPGLAQHMVFVTAHQLDPGEMEFFMGLRNQIIHKPFALRQVLAVASQVVGE